MAINLDDVVNSFNTICEMFDEREQHYIAGELRKIGPAEIDEMMRTKNTFVISIDDKLRIIYCLEAKIKATDIKKHLDDTEFENYLIVIRDKISANNMKILTDAKKQIQFFEIRELKFNISKHSLVPKHRIIPANSAQVKMLFEKMFIKNESQLPVILRSDPMAKFLNAKKGDLIEITRYSPTSAQHTFYRICV